MSQPKNHILVIDDEAAIRKMLRILLEANGYKVTECETGQSGISMATSVKPDAILLDLGLPDIEGKDVIESLRTWSQAPIIVCSVRNEDSEIVNCLKLGADDYLNKPFNPDILLARMHSILRRSVKEETGEPCLENGNIVMDLVKHETKILDQVIGFTPKEYELLRYFMINKGKMLTHKQILKEVWGPAHGDDMQYLRVYLSQLREKLQASDPELEYISTETGVGYRMEIIKVGSQEQAS